MTDKPKLTLIKNEPSEGDDFNMERCHIMKDQALRKLWKESENEEAFLCSTFFLMLDCASHLAYEGFEPIDLLEGIMEEMKESSEYKKETNNKPFLIYDADGEEE